MSPDPRTLYLERLAEWRAEIAHSPQDRLERGQFELATRHRLEELLSSTAGRRLPESVLESGRSDSDRENR